MPPVSLEIIARSSVFPLARAGRVSTLHGVFDTPAFMPVGTRASVKGLLPSQVAATGSQILLNNTYHLLLRPGAETVARLGGVHRFMNWDGAILTDSGGYQAYSLSDVNSVDDEGVTFRSVVDGSKVRLTPEEATRVQNVLGADIIMAFDDCPPSIDPGVESPRQARLLSAVRRDTPARRGYDHGERLRTACERTVRWLERCVGAHGRGGEQALFGIVQGGVDLDMRSWCAERVTAIDCPGYAIGGVAVGEGHEQIERVVRHTAPLLPADRPRYLMGVGYERDIVSAVLSGVDMFDCVLPTRNGRNASAFTPGGQIRLRNARYAEDPSPLEEGCDCGACAPIMRSGPGGSGVFSRGYIRHLFMSGEMLGPILVSIHNVRYFQRLMADLRQAIATDDWARFRSDWPTAGGAFGGAGEGGGVGNPARPAQTQG